jgi:hypothetical protein
LGICYIILFIQGTGKKIFSFRSFFWSLRVNFANFEIWETTLTNITWLSDLIHNYGKGKRNRDRFFFSQEAYLRG